MDKKNPIGIFDSGVGGLTVVRSLLDKLPGESFIYFGDTAHVPYGNKSEEQLFGYARQILSYLLSRNVKAVIVACGTHSSVTLPSLEKVCTLPLLGVVKAGARAASKTSRNGLIGVIATHPTVNSRAYTGAVQSINSGLQVFERACPKFVPLVESGQLNGPAVREAIAEYIGPLMEEGIDTLILGCTHYPFLSEAIREYVGPAVNLVDPSDETIDEVQSLLASHDLLSTSARRDGCHEFFVSGQNESFFNVGKQLIGDVIKEVSRIELT
ncbi:MAG: glutamate racemase [Syntrophomonadaceae bacterium]